MSRANSHKARKCVSQGKKKESRLFFLLVLTTYPIVLPVLCPCRAMSPFLLEIIPLIVGS